MKYYKIFSVSLVCNWMAVPWGVWRLTDSNILNSVYLWDTNKKTEKILASSSCVQCVVKIHVVFLCFLISLVNYVFTETGVLPYWTWGWIRIPGHYRSYYCPQLNIFMHLKKVRRSAEDGRFIYIFYGDFHNSCIFERPKVIEAWIHMGILSFYFQGIKSSCLIVQWLKMKMMIKFIKLHYILTDVDLYT